MVQTHKHTHRGDPTVATIYAEMEAVKAILRASPLEQWERIKASSFLQTHQLDSTRSHSLWEVSLKVSALLELMNETYGYSPEVSVIKFIAENLRIIQPHSPAIQSVMVDAEFMLERISGDGNDNQSKLLQSIVDDLHALTGKSAEPMGDGRPSAHIFAGGMPSQGSPEKVPPEAPGAKQASPERPLNVRVDRRARPTMMDGVLYPSISAAMEAAGIHWRDSAGRKRFMEKVKAGAASHQAA